MKSAEIVLHFKQQSYAARLLSLSEGHPAQQILPVSFRDGDRHAQPGEQPIGDREWAETRASGSSQLGQRLAQQLASTLQIDSSAGFEKTEVASAGAFSGQIKVCDRDTALKEAKEEQEGLVI